MTNFFKIASVVQLLVAEFAVAMFLGGDIALWIVKPPGVTTEWFDFVFLAILAAVLAWLLSTIFLPRVTKDTFSTFGGAAVYPFCSTHPSYLGVDALILFTAWFLFWAIPSDSSAWAFERTRAWAVLGFALAFPVLRLMGWYVLRLRPPEHVRVDAWKPVAMLYGFFFIPIGLLTALPAYNIFIAPYKNLPVVDGGALAGGLESRKDLIDEEYKDSSTSTKMPKPVTRIVKLTGTQIDAKAETCGPYGPAGDDYQFATLRVDLGGGREVLALAYGTYQYDLVKRATGNQGKSIELYGRLRPIPKPGEIPEWMEICGLGKLDTWGAAAGTRWLFVVENP